MAKEAKPDVEPEENLDVEPEPKKRSPRLFILIGLISLVLFQAMAMFFLLPTPGQVASQVRGISPDVPPDYVMPTDVIPHADLNPQDLIEKPLGDKFQVQDLNPRSPGETNLFTVTVTVRIDKKDEKEFDKIYAARTFTIRDIVTSVLRASTLEERSEETLSSIKRKIRVRINEELGANYVKDVRCTDAVVGTM